MTKEQFFEELQVRIKNELIGKEGGKAVEDVVFTLDPQTRALANLIYDKLIAKE